MENIYTVLDGFLDHDTWASLHPYDSDRFFAAIVTIAQKPEFSPECLGEYIDRKKILSDRSEKYFLDARNRCVRDAETMHRYFAYLDRR